MVLEKTLKSPLDSKEINQSVLKEINLEYLLEGMMLKLMRRTDSLEKTLMMEKIESRRRRGQKRMRWLDGITGMMDMDMSLSILWEIAKKRGAWACCSP